MTPLEQRRNGVIRHEPLFESYVLLQSEAPDHVAISLGGLPEGSSHCQPHIQAVVDQYSDGFDRRV